MIADLTELPLIVGALFQEFLIGSGHQLLDCLLHSKFFECVDGVVVSVLRKVSDDLLCTYHTHSLSID